MLSAVPNLLGLGCAKCGTTSLASILSAHPDISCPRKEMHFFDQGVVTRDSFQTYISQYKPTRWRLDFTPSYIMDRNARFLIREWLGTDLRFIVILRNPVLRAYSHYCHAKKTGSPVRSGWKKWGIRWKHCLSAMQSSRSMSAWCSPPITVGTSHIVPSGFTSVSFGVDSNV
jgi:hypothetical protein